MVKKAHARKTRSYNKRRKGLLAFVVPWLRRFGIVLGVIVLIIWAGSWFWLSGAMHRSVDRARFQVREATAHMGFSVDRVLVEGRVYSEPSMIKALTNVQTGDPLFGFNPDEARALIERMEWVKSVHIERRWPDTIYIRIQERRPLAVLAKGKTRALLDEAGEVITRSDLSRFAALITVSGDGVQEAAATFLDILSGVPDMYERTKTALYIGQRRWDIRLKNGVSISLPEKDAGLALQRLSEAQAADGILERDIVAIDLRTPGRLIIRTRPGALQEYKKQQKAGSSI